MTDYRAQDLGNRADDDHCDAFFRNLLDEQIAAPFSLAAQTRQSANGQSWASRKETDRSWGRKIGG